MQFIAINGRVIELTGGRIQGAGEDDRLSPRLLSLLGYLVENTDRALTRDELIEAVWGHLDAATDDSVNVAVSSLRRAIGDDWRYYWWSHESYPSFAPMVDDPRSIEFNARLRGRVREQLEQFDANRDGPPT